MAEGVRSPKYAYVSVTPGGGKSLIPVIAATQLIPKLADKVCWVVPRDSLRHQGEHAFIETRRLIDHHLTIRASANEDDPSRGHDGFVTTYQALSVKGAADAALREYRRHRYITVLDEAHHISDGGPWHRAVQPLIDNAVFTIFMSGTWERGDRQRVANLPYEQDALTLVPSQLLRSRAAIDDTGCAAYVGYSRQDALRGHAIKPLRCFYYDGAARWIDGASRECSVASLAQCSEDEAPEAIFTALNTDYATDLMAKCVGDWQRHRQRRPSGKLLVIAADIAAAKQYLSHLRRLGVTRVDIATSADSSAAQSSIVRYKLPFRDTNRLDALVTVGMAYEGLDVPPISHVVFLSRIRSRPWVEQAISRAVRVDPDAGPWESQAGYIYGPDDALLRACISAIIAEQQAVISDIEVPEDHEDADAANAVVGVERARSPILPLWGKATDERLQDLSDGHFIAASQLAGVRQVLERHFPEMSVDPVAFLRAIHDMHGVIPSSDSPAPAQDVPMAPSERERKIREQIDRYVKTHEGKYKLEWGTINKEMFNRFRKKRKSMTERELTEAWTWVTNEYPL